MVFPADSIGFVWADWEKRSWILCSYQPFCYVGVFRNLSDTVAPNLRGASGDLVTISAYTEVPKDVSAASSLP